MKVIRLKLRVVDKIKDVRTLMVKLKRLTLMRETLKKYSNLGPVIDVATRWNSIYLMLKRFNILQNSIQKAAIDSEKFKSIMNTFTKEDMDDLKSLEDFLHPFDVATKQLSKSGTNLHQADLIVQILLDAIQSSEIQEYCIERLSRRRSLCLTFCSFYLMIQLV